MDGFLEELEWRGMIQDFSPGLEEILSNHKIVGYIGFDPTAPSLTIGNYVQIMILKHFQKYGHTPLVLMGGATGRIGDPSGKDKERELKSYIELDTNLAKQKDQIYQALSFSGVHNPAIMANNLDFYENMPVLDFLRNVGKHITINYMMAKESVKKRVEIGMSYTEFSYQLLQAYDFLCLYNQFDCILQMGGSDQWGNITSGTEYIRRVSEGKAYALTTPLLTKADGTKFGKSERGNIWLDPKMTSPYQFYQFWVNADDRDLPKFFRYFSLKSKSEITQLEAQYTTDPNSLKRILAEELTCRIHGDLAYQAVLKVSELLFNPRLDEGFLGSLSQEQWEALSAEIPVHHINTVHWSESTNILDFLTSGCQILPSKGEARRAIQGNAISINKSRINSSDLSLNTSQLIKGKYILVENGKKNKHLVIVD